MKNIMKLMGALILVCSFSFANAQMRDSSSAKMSSTQNKTGNMSPKEYVTMKGGAVMLYKDGKTTALASAYKAGNGTTVSTNGTITKNDGTTSKLAEGDKVYKDGHCKKNGTGTQKMN